MDRCALGLLLAGAATFVVAYVAIAVIRVRYPFELEWMEGGSVVHVQRVLDGQSLYGRPSLEFTPFIYPPFYYYASAVPARILGNGFLPLRLVSFAASIGSFALIGMLVHRRTRSASASFLASCLFAAAFTFTGAWFDLARVDSLAVFFILGGAYLLEATNWLGNTIGAATLLFLAFFTKQSSAIAAASLAAAVLVTRSGRNRFLLPGLVGMLIAGSVLVMNIATDGWFVYYIFDVPSRHPIETNLLLEFWTTDLGTHLPIAFGFCVFGLVASGGLHSHRHAFVMDAALFGGLIMTSYFSRIHSGGFDNVLMPAAAGIAIFFGIGIAAATKMSTRSFAGTAAMITAAIQFLMLTYSPRDQVPTAAARAGGEQLLRRVEAIDGEVYLPDHPWYAVAAGKAPQAQTMSLGDLLRARGSDTVRDSLRDELRFAVDQERFAAFVLDDEQFLLRPPDFDRHYRLVDEDLSNDEFVPLTGMKRAPKLLFTRRSNLR